MNNAYGKNISLTIFGGSHDDEIGMTLDGFPKGLTVDRDALLALMARRAPGSTPLGTPRKESDIPLFTEGIDENGTTTGGRIRAVIKNENKRSSDYSFIYDTPRPGHADFAALKKYGSSVDLRGGGRFSGRLTAPLTIAGGLALQYLAARGISIGAHIASVGNVYDDKFDTVLGDTTVFDAIKKRALPVINEQKGEEMAALIKAVREEGDSIGGTVECMITGLDIGLGEHMFDGVEGRISSMMYAIPAVKGVAFGAGFDAAKAKGSDNNDAFYTDGKDVKTKTNRAGGILGGMTNGMPVHFTVAIKPTPSIAKEQETVSLARMENTTLSIKGRHDPCILPRVIPVVEAGAALAVLDLLLDEQPTESSSDLAVLRQKIDRIDRELVALFSARMAVSAGVAEYKRSTGMPVTDSTREAALLDRVAALASPDTKDYTRTLYTNILALSRAYQHARLGTDSALAKEIASTAKSTAESFPLAATVACQGLEGAYSCKAAARIFQSPDIHHYKQFADVFKAIEEGECRYGILPIENSTAGSVTEIYDLMAKHRFSIVRAVRLDIDHCLLTKNGQTIDDIKEIVSHPQALSQCAGFLAAHKDIKITPMANTAIAAQHVANASGGVAAIADRGCADLYGLTVAKEHICDAAHNRTRFICISKSPEIYPDADKTSVILTLPHRAGSLSRLLVRFDALQINLTKLESRPIPGRDFEFRFYFDLACPVKNPALVHLLTELAGESEEFRYLGTYTEIE